MSQPAVPTPSLITVSVMVALPQRQQRVWLQLEPGTQARAALQQAIRAGLDLGGTDLNADSVPLAVHGEPIDDSRPLADGDRLELLRPLRQAPTELRRQRAGRRSAR